MTEETPRPLPPLTPEERARIERLTEREVREIDEALLAQASSRWRKVARVVGFALSQAGKTSDVPVAFYAQRICNLVEEGRLEAQGNLDYIRFSEVRLPTSEGLRQ